MEEKEIIARDQGRESVPITAATSGVRQLSNTSGDDRMEVADGGRKNRSRRTGGLRSRCLAGEGGETPSMDSGFTPSDLQKRQDVRKI
ncbi:hypothetical protein AVEN_273743-1 [Araneus ventricosus]|uniref:Uncharacterized protein n=1 Tax=Araneus ventricosus TaxID=182803 RepID=A0A4Y2R9N9_ARAVE|nr:hypothetical protein AVEN_273743-1 [Araneus ventricosus]